jgi:hypothetical protein
MLRESRKHYSDAYLSRHTPADELSPLTMPLA